MSLKFKRKENGNAFETKVGLGIIWGNAILWTFIFIRDIVDVSKEFNIDFIKLSLYISIIWIIIFLCHYFISSICQEIKRNFGKCSFGLLFIFFLAMVIVIFVISIFIYMFTISLYGEHVELLGDFIINLAKPTALILLSALNGFAIVFKNNSIKFE